MQPRRRRKHLIWSCVLLLGARLSFAQGQCGNVNSPYGINAHAPAGANLTPLFDKVQAAGLGWVRIDFNWFAIETSQDVFNWSIYDSIAGSASARGIRIFATLAYTPQWATSGVQQTGVPNSPADWYDFCFRAAQRYPSIQHWGMWNEPNLSQFWAGTRTQYINDILKNGADAIHAANPAAKVCGPETAHIGSTQWFHWLRESILQASGKLDIVTHHMYDNDGNGDITNKLEDSTFCGTNSNCWNSSFPPSVKEVLQNTGWYGNPFWFTETGWGSDVVGESNQAAYYNGLLTDWFTGLPNRDWLHKVFFYEVQDDPTPGVTKWGILNADFTEKPAYTSYKNFITAHPPSPAAPCKATSPVPASGSTNVGLGQILSWTAGLAASSHNVYFGTSSPGTFRGNQATASYNPGPLSANVTYYWRIDEVNGAGTTTGDVWTFTTAPPTPPGLASNPSPAHLATGVSLAADLSWSAGSGATSHSVYFGTTSPGLFRVNQAGTTFDPGPLASFTTYFWRIDEVNSAGTTTGDVWRFTAGGQRGDLDGDGDVDLSDFGIFQLCLSGPGTPYTEGCAPVDWLGDGDVDSEDVGFFVECLEGANRPPGC